MYTQVDRQHTNPNTAASQGNTQRTPQKLEEKKNRTSGEVTYLEGAQIRR